MRLCLLLPFLIIHVNSPQTHDVFEELKTAAATNTLTEDALNDLLHKEKLSRNQLGEAVRAAAKKGYIEPIDLLIRYNANIHVQEENALRTAAKLGYANIVQLLLEHGANFHIRLDWPLIEAFDENKISVVKTLLDWSRKPKIKAFSRERITHVRDEAQEEPREEEMLKLFNDYLEYLKNIEVHR